MRVFLSSKNQSPFGVVDCDESPWNLRLPLEAIMTAQNWILERLPQDKPLIILMGEVHKYQTHSFLQKKLLEALAAQKKKDADRSFAFGVELPHNLLHVNKAADPHGRILLGAFQKLIIEGPALAARKDLFKTCLTHNISSSFNDIAAIDAGPKCLIDQRDPFSAHMVTRYKTDMIGQDIIRSAEIASLSSSHGIMLSNQAIVENATAHIERVQPRVYVQHCGLNHVFGKKDTAPHIRQRTDKFCEYPYQDSLSVAFQKRGYDVLPVLMDYHPQDNNIPEEAAPMLSRSVLIQDMADSTTHSTPYTALVETIHAYSEFTY